jgi:hypothetical protein
MLPLGLDVMYSYKAVVDLSRNVLRLGQEEVPLGLASDTKSNSKVADVGRC